MEVMSLEAAPNQINKKSYEYLEEVLENGNPKGMTFTVDSAMAMVNSMRAEADINYTHYEMIGRNKTRDIMENVYSLWHEAKASNEYNNFIANIKQQLKHENVKIKSTTKDSSILIRCIFKNASDKQVHVYGRALDVAYKNKTAPNDFAGLIDRTEGGFNGLRDSAKPETDSGDKQHQAFNACLAERSVDTVEGMTWKTGEKFIIFIAVRNDDDTADLKTAILTDEQKQAILRSSVNNKKKNEKAAANPKANSLSKALVADFELQIAEQQSIFNQLTLEFDMLDRDDALKTEKRMELQVAELKLNALQDVVKQTKAALKV